ncbi:MAG: potassium transporter KtrB [Leptolyngbya sp. SIO1E4]|nr:potassium transporter KtrB [Leptolyngbya sp. SIO1E4]
MSKPSPLRFLIRPFSKLGRSNPLRVLLWGYGSYILVAWILLCLPICWQGDSISPLDNLFIATSAVSTTGLITVNTPDAYNFLGEFVVLSAFQVGGLGYMTLGSFVLLASNDSLPHFRRQIGSAVFAMPEGFDLKLLIRHTVIFTVLAEAIGAIFLAILFAAKGVENPVWAAIFHAVSAFCTAGFSVFPNSLEDFRNDFWINLVVSILSILGAIGFLVVSDFWQGARGRRRRIALTTRVILYLTSCFLIIGFLLLLLFDQSLWSLPFGERLLAAWFQSMTALTTVGFNTHPIGSLSAFGVLLTLVLMIVGASPSGTGGGLKSTTISAALGVMWSALKGRGTTAYLGRRIPEDRLFAAFSAIVFYLFIFLLGAGGLLLFQSQPFEDVLFEAASALGTVGLSRGITGDLTAIAKLIVIFLMFVGRIGPLSFGIALFYEKSKVRANEPMEDLAI